MLVTAENTRNDFWNRHIRMQIISLNILSQLMRLSNTGCSYRWYRTVSINSSSSEYGSSHYSFIVIELALVMAVSRVPHQSLGKRHIP